MRAASRSEPAAVPCRPRYTASSRSCSPANSRQGASRVRRRDRAAPPGPGRRTRAQGGPGHDRRRAVGLGLCGGHQAAQPCPPGRVLREQGGPQRRLGHLVGSLGDGVADPAPPQPGADRSGAVALVTQDMRGPHPGASRAWAGHPDRLHHGGELGAVVGVAARDDESERAAHTVAGQVNLAGQAASGASEGRAAEPPFRAPVSADDRGVDRHQPVDVAGGVRLRLGGAEHPLERAVRRPPAKTGVKRGPRPVPLGHIPPGRARTELPHDPVEDSAVIQPLAPRNVTGSNGRTNSHSASDSSWRRIT